MLKAVLTDADFGCGEPRLVEDISRYGARGVLLDENNNCAMMLMSANGFYKLPGGGIELGERETDAFVREVLEETGCKCEIIEKLGTIEEHNYKRKFCQFSFAFLARKTGEAEQNLTREENALGMAVNWMSLADASAVLGRGIEMAPDRKMLSILKRDKTILDYLIAKIDSGEIKI